MQSRRNALYGTMLVVVIVCVVRIQSVAAPVDETITFPTGETIRRGAVDFERHIASLLSREGCNSAACHGSFQGRGGLRLSLFGYSAKMDYAALSDVQTGRIDLDDPPASLILLKPTSGEDHGGGTRFKRDSWQYRLILAWIENGAMWNQHNSKVRRLAVRPAEITIGAGRSAELHVETTFVDGTRQNLTSLSTFYVKDPSVANISTEGRLHALRGGDTSVIVSYRGNIRSVPVIVPFSCIKGNERELPAPTNLIDRHIFTKLRRLCIDPSELASDVEFLRRAKLDVIGALPDPAEIRQFLSNCDPNKRFDKIEELLDHPMRAALWATRMCDITGCDVQRMESPKRLRSRRAKMWHDWFRKRFNENTPYDQIVHDVLCASSRDNLPLMEWIERETQLIQTAENGFTSNYADRSSLDLYWRRIGDQNGFPLEDMAELTCSAFLGVRIGCARCHKHPFDRWSQNDYNGFANIFAPVQFGSSPELRHTVADLLKTRRQAENEGKQTSPLPRLSEVYVSPHGRRLRDVETKRVIPAKPLGGDAFDPVDDAREELFNWLKHPDNPFFARNFANRIWRNFFGRGLVEPVDDFSMANPPTHPALLDELAQEFIDSGYDIKHIERLILTSSTYQLSSSANISNRMDQRNYSHTSVRPLIAEVAIDAINAFLGVRDDFGDDVPRGNLAIEIAPNVVSDPEVVHVLKVFGRGERQSLCDCDRINSPSLRRTLYRMSNAGLMNKLSKGRLRVLFERGKSDNEIVEELFLASFSRFPTDGEMRFLCNYITSGTDRKQRLVDVTWGIINSREFVTNH